MRLYHGWFKLTWNGRARSSVAEIWMTGGAELRLSAPPACSPIRASSVESFRELACAPLADGDCSARSHDVEAIAPKRKPHTISLRGTFECPRVRLLQGQRPASVPNRVLASLPTVTDEMMAPGNELASLPSVTDEMISPRKSSKPQGLDSRVVPDYIDSDRALQELSAAKHTLEALYSYGHI